jgi:lysophospholipase L1-like esterase
LKKRNHGCSGIKGGSILVFLLFLAFCGSKSPGIIILCAGDSITEAGYPRFLHRILKAEGMRNRVINVGRSGHNSKEYLQFMKKNQAEMAEDFPDFVLLQLGTNDVRIDGDRTQADEFYLNMKKIVRLFRGLRTRNGKNPLILLAKIPPVPEGTPFPFDSTSKNRVWEEINPLIERIAREENLPLVDNYSLFLDSPHLLPGVHPSKEGYEAMASNWFEALRKTGVRPKRQ